MQKTTALSHLPGLRSLHCVPDASQFPAQGTRFIGNTNSSVWDIDVGTVEVANGQLTVHIAPVPGYGTVVDNLRLVAPDGRELLFEAEDPSITTGECVLCHP